MLEEIAAPPYQRPVADLPHLADSLQLEIDDLFPLGETLQLLRFAEFADADIKLTPRSASASSTWTSISARKCSAISCSPTFRSPPISSGCSTSGRAIARPATRFREELEDFMSEDYAERTLRAIINLGRYGELFAYDESAQTFSYENPT